MMFKQLCVPVINTTQTVDTYDEQARRPAAKYLSICDIINDYYYCPLFIFDIIMTMVISLVTADVKDCLHGTIATAIFLEPQMCCMGLKSKCSHGEK